MTITTAPLSISEKAALKKLFSLRVLLGMGIILPLMVASLWMGISSLLSFFTGTQDAGDFFGIIFSMVCTYFFIRYAFPFYQHTLSNIRATNKLIIDTYIIDIHARYVSGVGYSYTVFTETQKPLRSTKATLIDPTYGYKDMSKGLEIRIHCLENNPNDILRIEPR